jgi:hypothetical protein
VPGVRVEDLFCREYVVIGEEANVMHCTKKKKKQLETETARIQQ